MENSKIEWTEHTLNLWWGCEKISPGCKHCYADTLDNRWGGGHWGPGSTRRYISSWRKSLEKMSKAAIRDGRKHRVFVMSMGDIFEESRPIAAPEGLAPTGTTMPVRQRLLSYVERMPELSFLLLTKRPENIKRVIPNHYYFWQGCKNLYFGCSIVNQEEANTKIPVLRKKTPEESKIFLSMEPLLGPVELTREQWQQVSWVIVGGESGPKARPMNPKWVRSIRDQCKDAGVPFFFKQWGEWVDGHRVGKKAAGRELDGRTHDDYPQEMTAPLQ